MIVAVVFWGCIAASIALSALGLLLRSPRLLFLSSAFAAPLALYCAATPRFGIWGLLLPVPQLASGFVVRRSLWLALALGSFFTLFVAWLKLILTGSVQSVAV